MRNTDEGRTRRARAALALPMLILSIAAAAPKADAPADDWTVPAIIAGIMVFILLYNLITGKGSVDVEGGDGCGGGD